MALTTTANGRPDKSKKQSKVVILKLPPSLLDRFVSKPTTKASSTTSSTPVDGIEEPPSLQPLVSADNASESNSTPAPGQDAPTPGDGSKKRKAPSAAPRRSLNPNVDNMLKPRGKPGPKKKPRNEDGTIDHTTKPVVAATTNHKLGPKANTGAINAGLRALDRSGAPCRKWQRKGFQLKSFTGVVWEIPTWKAGEKYALLNNQDGDSTSENKDASMQSSDDIKPNGSDAAMDSNIGDQPDLMALSTPAASSPAPIPASTTIASQA